MFFIRNLSRTILTAITLCSIFITNSITNNALAEKQQDAEMVTPELKKQLNDTLTSLFDQFKKSKTDDEKKEIIRANLDLLFIGRVFCGKEIEKDESAKKAFEDSIVEFLMKTLKSGLKDKSISDYKLKQVLSVLAKSKTLLAKCEITEIDKNDPTEITVSFSKKTKKITDFAPLGIPLLSTLLDEIRGKIGKVKKNPVEVAKIINGSEASVNKKSKNK